MPRSTRSDGPVREGKKLSAVRPYNGGDTRGRTQRTFGRVSARRGDRRDMARAAAPLYHHIRQLITGDRHNKRSERLVAGSPHRHLTRELSMCVCIYYEGGLKLLSDDFLSELWNSFREYYNFFLIQH